VVADAAHLVASGDIEGLPRSAVDSPYLALALDPT
jgi:hypothetical protein